MGHITLDIKHLQLPNKPKSVSLNEGKLVFNISGKQDYEASVMQLFSAGAKFVKFEYNKEHYRGITIWDFYQEKSGGA